jgi:hypothetical protein
MMRSSLSIACALLAGCTLVNDPSRHQQGGQADAGTDAGPPPRIEVAEVCAEYADVMCGAYFGCCTAGVALQADPLFEQYRADCVTEAQRVCREGENGFSVILQDLVDDFLTGYDPVIGAEVIAEGRTLAATCDTGFQAWAVERDGLARALRGTRAGGAECTPGPFMGLRPDYAALLSCEADEDGEHRACVSRGGTWNCVVRGGDGAPCISYMDCRDGYYCTAFVGGTCARRKGAGEACTEHTQCMSLFCSATAETCATPTQDDVYCP